MKYRFQAQPELVGGSIALPSQYAMFADPEHELLLVHDALALLLQLLLKHLKLAVPPQFQLSPPAETINS